MLIIPAIDIMDGKVVRLTKGDFGTQKKYAENPAKMAQDWVNKGAQKLYLIDLDGAKNGRVVNWEALREIRAAAKVPIEVGGGIRTFDEAKRLLSMGIEQVILGSVAFREPQLVRKTLDFAGTDRVLLAVDFRDGKMAYDGWQKQTNLDYRDFLWRFEDLGLQNILVTDITRDGTLKGINEQLVREVSQLAFAVTWAGGVTSEADLVCLKNAGIPQVVIGKALYEGRLSLDNLTF